jgi:hypothetical protein
MRRFSSFRMSFAPSFTEGADSSVKEEWFPSKVDHMLPHYDHVRSSRWPDVNTESETQVVNWLGLTVPVVSPSATEQ